MAQIVLGKATVTLKPQGLIHWEDFDLALGFLRASKFKGSVSSASIEWGNSSCIAFHVYLGDKDCSSIEDGIAQLTSLFTPHFEVTVSTDSGFALFTEAP
jgi:hypothetical protein